MRWFGVKTDPCNPDTDRDGLPDGLELGITEKIYDFDPRNPQMNQFGGTAYDSNSEDDKYIFYTQAPTGATRKIRRFIIDGDPDSRSDPSHHDTNRDGHLDSESDLEPNGIIDTGKDDPALGLIVHPDEYWIYDDNQYFYLPNMEFNLSSVIGKVSAPIVYVKSGISAPCNLIASDPSILSINKINIPNLPPGFEAFELLILCNNWESFTFSYNRDNNFKNNDPDIPLPKEVKESQYNGYWPPIFQYSNDPYNPGPDIDHILLGFVHISPSEEAAGIVSKYFGNWFDNIVYQDKIRKFIEISARNWYLKPEFLGAILLRESIDVYYGGWLKILGECDPRLPKLIGKKVSSLGIGQMEEDIAMDLIWERFGIPRNQEKGIYRGGTNSNVTYQHSFKPEGLYKPVDPRFSHGLTNISQDNPKERKYKLRWEKVALYYPGFIDGDNYIMPITSTDNLFTRYRNPNDGSLDKIEIKIDLLRGNLLQNIAFNIELVAQQIRRTASSQYKYSPNASILKNGRYIYSKSGRVLNPPFVDLNNCNKWNQEHLKWEEVGNPPRNNDYVSYYGFTTILELDISVIEKDGNEWPYDNEALFLLWETINDEANYDCLSEQYYYGRPYKHAPSLRTCYDQINDKWK